MKRHTRTTIAAAALAALTLTACSGGGSSEGGDDASSGDQTTTTVDIRVTPPTLPAGQQVELGSVESVIQELDPACADAVQPIRDLQKEYQSALELKNEDLPQMNDALSEGFKICSADDWARYQELELNGWLNAIPSDEAIEQAQQEALERQGADGDEAPADPPAGAPTDAPDTQD